MKQFIGFLIVIFGGLSFFYFNKNNQQVVSQSPTVKIYASSSFVAKWGPGPELQQLFYQKTGIRIEFIESSDLSMTLQKISFENESSTADVVIGLDQFDLVKQAPKIKWREIAKTTNYNYVDELAYVTEDKFFMPYDWAPMTFIIRSGFEGNLEKLDDLLKPEFKNKIALQDPRTSSPGLQFLAWVFESKPQDEAVSFLKAMMKQAHSFSPSWSAAYGLFKNQQADLVFSYVTSPVYHFVEEQDSNYSGVELQEPVPVQVEFAGVPATCKSCIEAEKFVNFLASNEAQKILMSKNYMFPVIKNIKEGTAFDSVKIYKTLPIKLYEITDLNRWVEQWARLRMNEAQ